MHKADADFLTSMATETDGIYVYADDYPTLIAAFESATEKTAGRVTATYAGHVDPGEVVTTALLNVGSLIEQVTLILNWDGRKPLQCYLFF